MKETGNSTIIRLFNVDKRYGKKLALRNVSLEVEKGEFVMSRDDWIERRGFNRSI